MTLANPSYSLLFILLSLSSFSQSTIYSEDFSSQNGKGAIGGVSNITIDTSGVTWSVDTSDVNFQDASDYVQVVNENLEFRDTEGNAKWTSASIDISNLTSLTLSMDLSEVGTMESSDTISVYFKIDNGSETLIRVINDDFGSISLTDTSISGTGSSLYIIVYGKNGADSEKYRIDNIIVKGSCGSSPTEPFGFTATSSINNSTLTWTSPFCYSEVLIVAKLSSNISGTPSGDGTAYTANNDFSAGGTAFDGGKVVYKGSANTVSISNLTSTSKYYFKIWARTGTNWSSGIEINSTILYIPKLIIAELADPSDEVNARFAELFNADTLSIDFSVTDYFICKETNGGGSFNCTQLTGSLAPGHSYVVANNASTFSTEYSKTASGTFGNTAGNGDDGYFLYIGGDNTTGTLLDAYGVVSEDGSGKSWEYTDSRAYRDSNLSTPNTTWTASEWTINSAATIACEPFDHASAFPEITLTSNFSLIEGSYATLNINGSSTVVNAIGDVTVLNKLRLKNGLFNLNGNKLILGNEGSDCVVSDASASSFIYGGTTRYYVNSSTGTYKFEIGTGGTEYSRLEVDFNSSTLTASAYLDGSVNNIKHPNLPGHVVSYLDRNWTIEATGISSLNYDISLLYDDDDIQGTESTLFPVKYSGGAWTAPGTVGNGNVDTVGSGSVTVGTNTLSWTGVTSFSIFTGVGDGSPLPVELLYFRGNRTPTGNLLNWATASELNSDYFEIQKLSKSDEFISIGRVNSSGFSNSKIVYELLDNEIEGNNNHYRIKQVDFNGTTSFSKIIAINQEEKSIQDIEIKSISKELTLNYLPKGIVNIEIISLSGVVLYERQISNESIISLNLVDIPNGVYLVKTYGENKKSSSYKFMLSE